MSPRRHRVLELIAEGYTNDQIARALDISEETVKTHVRKLLGALGARCRAHAVAIGFRKGLLG